MIRTVPLSTEQAKNIERIGIDLMRRGNHEDGTELLTIYLGWTVSPVARFKCDIDESAGLAEVHDLHDFSKKVS